MITLVHMKDTYQVDWIPLQILWDNDFPVPEAKLKKKTIITKKLPKINVNYGFTVSERKWKIGYTSFIFEKRKFVHADS